MRKLVIIGLDSFSYRWLDPLFARGYLKNIRKLIKEGSFALLKTPIVGATPHNWACISTGTVFRNHGCTWWVRAPGLTNALYGFSSQTLKAEPIWAATSRAGVKSILIDVPQSFPVLWSNVIHVGEDGRPDSSYLCVQVSKGYLSEDLYEEYMKRAELAAEPLPTFYWVIGREHLVKVRVKRASGWIGINVNGLYETEIPIYLEGKKYVGDGKGAKKEIARFYLLINPANKVVELYSEKRAEAKLGSSRLGSWSEWILYRFRVNNEETIRACFRFKLLRLGASGKNLHVYFSQIYPVRGFTHPEELSEELVKACGPYLHTPTRQQVVLCGACDVYTFIEELEYQGRWYAKALRYLMQQKKDWGLIYVKYHAPDFLNHLCAYMIDERHPLYEPDKLEEAWKLWARVLEPADEMVKAAMEAVGDEGVVAVVSDHGSKLMHPAYMYTGWLAGRMAADALEREGFIVRKSNGDVDWSKSIVRPGSFGYNIAVKGRDLEGVLRPEEYERVRLRVIEILRDLRNPATGAHLFKLVCRREDAEALGYGGPHCADIFVWPNYGEHLELEYERITREDFEKLGIKDLGTWEWPTGIPTGAHDEIAMFIVRGPTVKRGYKCKRVYSLVNVAPTLCHATGLPMPKDSTGGVIWEIFEE